MIYVAEAHPTDGWQVPQNVKDGILVAKHLALSDREKAAEMLQKELKLKLPIAIDALDDAISKAYDGWPDRIFIVDKDLKIAYRGGQGPFGFKPLEAKAALAKLLGK